MDFEEYPKYEKNDPKKINVGMRWPCVKTFLLAFVPGLTLGLLGVMLLRIYILKMRLHWLQVRYENSFEWYKELGSQRKK